MVQDLYTYDNVNVPSGDESLYYGSPLFVFPTYRLRTPSKITGSAAYIINKRGLISIDVASKNYGNIEYTNTNQNDFRDLNSQLSRELKMHMKYELEVSTKSNNGVFVEDIVLRKVLTKLIMHLVT